VMIQGKDSPNSHRTYGVSQKSHGIRQDGEPATNVLALVSVKNILTEKSS